MRPFIDRDLELPSCNVALFCRKERLSIDVDKNVLFLIYHPSSKLNSLL